MRNKDDLLRAYQDDEDRLLAARSLDKAMAAEKSGGNALGDFCDPRQAVLIADLLRRRGGEAQVAFWGGYGQAERCRPTFFTDGDAPTAEQFGLTLLRVDGRIQEKLVTHRDVLGAVLSLGIKREKLGDIIVDDRGCYLIITDEMASYVTNNLTQIHRVSVTVRSGSFSQLADYQRPYQEITTVVASLRLDAIAAAAFGMSRGDAVGEIESHKMKVNWQDCDDVAHSMKEGDVLSLRGQGRAVLKQVVGETKKGRLRLTIARPL